MVSHHVAPRPNCPEQAVGPPCDFLTGSENVAHRYRMPIDMKIFLILHHEIMGVPDNYRADEMVFYTARSLRKALELIKKTYVSRWSWWEVQVSELDDTEWPDHVGYFGPRGGKIVKPSFEKMVAIFEERPPDCR
ncbi:hypothetical protein [Schlesneria sp. T3-172]|uniref:hypothetical protein n=1 Tax=Schlesneria sphaerica TaxID=3373610 RepID=UPI0037CC17E0